MRKYLKWTVAMTLRMLHQRVSTFESYNSNQLLSTLDNITSSQIPRISWNPEICYSFHQTLPLVPILSQMNQAHLLPPYFFRSVLILSSNLRLGLPSCLSSMLSNQIPVGIILILPCIQHALSISVSIV
jgi:hypothetical protein